MVRKIGVAGCSLLQVPQKASGSQALAPALRKHDVTSSRKVLFWTGNKVAAQLPFGTASNVPLSEMLAVQDWYPDYCTNTLTAAPNSNSQSPKLVISRLKTCEVAQI